MSMVTNTIPSATAYNMVSPQGRCADAFVGLQRWLALVESSSVPRFSFSSRRRLACDPLADTPLHDFDLPTSRTKR